MAIRRQYPPADTAHPDATPQIPSRKQAEPTNLPIDPGEHLTTGAVNSDSTERGQHETGGIAIGTPDLKRYGWNGVGEDEGGQQRQNGPTTEVPELEIYKTSEEAVEDLALNRGNQDNGDGLTRETLERELFEGKALELQEPLLPLDPGSVADKASQLEGQQPQPPLTDKTTNILTAHSTASAIGEISHLNEPQQQPLIRTERTATLIAHATDEGTPLHEAHPGETACEKSLEHYSWEQELDRGSEKQHYETGVDVLIESNQPLRARTPNGQKLERHLWEPNLGKGSYIRDVSADAELHRNAAVYLGPKLIRKLDEIRRLGGQALQKRVELAEKRREVRRQRSELRDSDADLMKAFNEAQVKGIPAGSLHIQNLYDVVSENRNKLGPLEESYDDFEDDIDQLDYKLGKLETQFYTAVSELLEDTGDRLARAEESKSSSEDSSSSEDEMPQLHPIEYDYLSKVGDANIVRERINDLNHNYAQILEEEKIRKPHNIPLSQENSDFLDAYPSDRAELEEEARVLQVAIEELRQKCIKEGLMGQDQQLLQGSKPTHTPPTDSRDASDSDGLNRFPNLAKYSRKYGELISGFANTRDRVNFWLFHVFRSSSIEISLYRSFQTDPPEDDRQWDRLFSERLVECWRTDGAATGERLSPTNSPTGSQKSLAGTPVLDNQSTNNTPDHQSATIRDHPESIEHKAEEEDPVNKTPQPLSPSEKGSKPPLTRQLSDSQTICVGGVFPNSEISIDGTLSVLTDGNCSNSSPTDCENLSLSDFADPTYTCRHENAFAYDASQDSLDLSPGYPKGAFNYWESASSLPEQPPYWTSPRISGTVGIRRSV